MTMVRMLLLLTIGCLPQCFGDENRPAERESRMAYLDNGIIKVGVDLDRGGSIGLLADVRQRCNVVNTHDLGPRRSPGSR